MQTHIRRCIKRRLTKVPMIATELVVLEIPTFVLISDRPEQAACDQGPHCLPFVSKFWKSDVCTGMARVKDHFVRNSDG